MTEFCLTTSSDAACDPDPGSKMLAVTADIIISPATTSTLIVGRLMLPK